MGIFLDLKGAFETDNYNIILDKSYTFGIRCNAYIWFKSYLSNKKRIVHYKNSESEIK